MKRLSGLERIFNRSMGTLTCKIPGDRNQPLHWELKSFPPAHQGSPYGPFEEVQPMLSLLSMFSP